MKLEWFHQPKPTTQEVRNKKTYYYRTQSRRSDKCHIPWKLGQPILPLCFAALGRWVLVAQITLLARCQLRHQRSNVYKTISASNKIKSKVHSKYQPMRNPGTVEVSSFTFTLISSFSGVPVSVFGRPDAASTIARSMGDSMLSTYKQKWCHYNDDFWPVCT